MPTTRTTTSPSPEGSDILRQRVETLGLQMYEARVLPRLLKSGYVDAWTQVGVGSPETCCNKPEPMFRIDYILVSAPLAPHLRSCRRWDTGNAFVASDHLPVLVELDY